MEPLISIIQTDESDTFDARALRLQRHEAEALARKLFARLCTIVAEGGALTCDGDRLADLLDTLRAGREAATRRRRRA